MLSKETIDALAEKHYPFKDVIVPALSAKLYNDIIKTAFKNGVEKGGKIMEAFAVATIHEMTSKNFSGIIAENPFNIRKRKPQRSDFSEADDFQDRLMFWEIWDETHNK